MRQTLFILFCYAGGVAPGLRAEPVDFVRDVRPVFEKHCTECHGEKKQKSGLRLDVKAAAFKGGEEQGSPMVPGKPEESPLIRVVTSADTQAQMPPKGPRLNAAEVATLTRWVGEGARWPDGVDKVKLADPRAHWAFQPLAVATGEPSIDSFITAKLHENNLTMSPAADPLRWLRRVTLDLTGLPPTPEEMAQFVPATAAQVVDRLLASPRYGERWAQHWLDVVRYADTHGFEVNTERPNAWPYRDYVIRAFNQDTPYDQFIREQMVGDALGEDAATGFLITASVLLPGQIGADEPSKRLARQDALDEMVVNVSQTFLGLSVGCARCHDHKFDPITAKDYYAMQAFLAGVEYEDRELRTPEAVALKAQAAGHRQRVAEIDRQLAPLVPLAHPAETPDPVTDAKQNPESFPPVEARFVRFTIHDTNRHPSLGLIEPCLDEFEIFTDGTPPRNVALASYGTRVSASGSRTSGMHRLEHLHDGHYGNARSWMSDTAGRGWVMFELPAPVRIASIVWGRDREGKFADRLATAFTLEAAQEPDQWLPLVQRWPQRPAVNPQVNTDRFAPVKTKRLRFTILATNNLEPCLDELEVFTSDGKNIALESRVTTSGSTTVADRHESRFVNDGSYGNARSWMSHEAGQGWVLLEFPHEAEISRVVWGRDREEKFQDRLATDYRIEIAREDETWQLVADASDRQPFVAGGKVGASFTLVGLSPEEAAVASRLMDEKQGLEQQIKATQQGQLAFAGKFRAPDKIHLLSRGDPEQPRDEIGPAVPGALGEVTLANDAPEQSRREALAGWIASPQNPLTARVMVNRIWQGHFGTGLVQTASDFGLNGIKPTHPELLDWLAQEFIRSGWSVKQLHRLIVLSATYRQASGINPAASAQDAEARLLWRFPPRRLEAESIRDAILFVSGQLDLKMYGRGFNLFDQRGGLSGFNPVESFTGDGLRRMIYAHKVRRESEAVFGAFDCPDAGQSTASRRESTTPIQALNLFNSRFTLEAAAALAARVTRETGGEPPAQIQRAYQLCLNREPAADELRAAGPVVIAHGLATLCRALFNSNEFLFLP